MMKRSGTEIMPRFYAKSAEAGVPPLASRDCVHVAYRLEVANYENTSVKRAADAGWRGGKLRERNNGGCISAAYHETWLLSTKDG